MRRLGLGLLLAAMATTPSRAATVAEPRLQRDFIYPAAVCQPFDTSQEVTYSLTVYNPGANPAVVICPLPISLTWRPRSSAPPPIPPFGAGGPPIIDDVYTPIVEVFNRNSAGGNVTCLLQNLKTNGDVLWELSRSTTSYSANTPIKLLFPVPLQNRLFDDLWQVACTLPPYTDTGSSAIASIMVRVEQP
jgi:hypothetical protein